MIYILIAVTVILTILVMGLASQVSTLNKALKETIDEQDRQNEDMIFLLQSRIEMAQVMEQHTKVLKFLLNEAIEEEGMPYPFMGPMGEA